jgi:hypothetical protein
MLSIKKIGQQVECRNFMDDEHQITIGIDSDLWPIIQQIANVTAKRKGWLAGHGSEWDYLNILIINLLSSRPFDKEPWEWI